MGRDVAGVHVVVAYARFSKAFIEEMGLSLTFGFFFLWSDPIECAD